MATFIVVFLVTVSLGCNKIEDRTTENCTDSCSTFRLKVYLAGDTISLDNVEYEFGFDYFESIVYSKEIISEGYSDNEGVINVVFKSDKYDRYGIYYISLKRKGCYDLYKSLFYDAEMDSLYYYPRFYMTAKTTGIIRLKQDSEDLKLDYYTLAIEYKSVNNNTGSFYSDNLKDAVFYLGRDSIGTTIRLDSNSLTFDSLDYNYTVIGNQWVYLTSVYTKEILNRTKKDSFYLKADTVNIIPVELKL